ncbi:PAS domain S-box protein [bacterium]|nr:PAS domain S-box protein [bacterium]
MIKPRGNLYFGTNLLIAFLSIFLSISTCYSHHYGNIRVSGDSDYPPYEFLNKDGEPDGFTVDLLKAIASNLNTSVEINLDTWQRVIDRLRAGEIDMISGLYYSLERDSLFDFSTPHLSVNHAIFVREDSPINTLDDILDQTIIVQEGDIMHEFLSNTSLFHGEIVLAENQIEAFHLLLDGVGDAALLAKLQAIYFGHQHKHLGYRFIDVHSLERDYCFAVQEGNDSLITILNEGLTYLKATGEYQQIYNKWFGVYEQGQTRQTLVRILSFILVPIIILILGILIWNWSLKKTVRARTADLKYQLEERVRTEKSLRQSENKWRTLVKYAPDIIMILQLDGTIDFINKTEGKYFKEESVGNNIFDLIDTDYREEVFALMERVKKTGEAQTLELPIRDLEGVTHWWLNRLGPVKENGGATKLLCISTDNTKSHLIANALKQEHDRAQNYLDIAGVIIVALDTDGCISLINRKGCEILGYREEELLGKNWFEKIIPESKRADLKAYFSELVEATDPPVNDGENPVLTKDGEEKIIHWYNSLIRNENGKIIGSLSSGEDVTRQIQMQFALETSEKRYRHLFEKSVAGIYGTSPDGTINECNDAFARMLGFDSPQEVLSLNAYDLFYTERDRESFLEVLLTEGTVRNYESRLKSKEGKPVDILENAVVITNNTGSPVEIQGTCINISMRKSTERELQQSEKRYRMVVESASEIIYMVDRKGNFTFANQAGLRFTGYSIEELNNFKYEELILDEHRAMVRRHYTRQLLHKTPSTYLEFPFERKDGQIKWIGQNTSLRLENDKVAGFDVIARDITQRKNAEEAMRISEQRFRDIFEQSNDLIYVIQEGKFKLVNPVMARTMGFSAEKMTDPSFSMIELIADESKEFIRDRLDNFDDSNSASYELKTISNTGERREFEVNLSPIRWEGKPAKLGIARDVTEKKMMEAKLMQSQKMEAIGRLAGGVAHDFNNLLTAITGNVELVRMQVDEEKTYYPNLLDIRKTADRAANLTKQLLAFSRRQVLAPKIINLNQVLSDMEFMLTKIIGEQIELSTYYDDDLPAVKADPSQLEQVILNLVVNARDAMPRGGKLTLETTNVLQGKMSSKLKERLLSGDYVMLAVSDTGVGMSEKLKNQIFEPFFTTKEQGKGTGFGLATVYGIIKQSGGEITVFSEEGKGTTMKVYLPRSLEVSEYTRPSLSADSSENPTGSETILVVEDDEDVRELVIQALEFFGYHVLHATSGKRALKLCLEMESPVDLIVTDIIMPEMNGDEFVLELRKFWQNVPVLFMSGYTETALVNKGELPPNTPYLQKPFRPHILAQKIRQLLDQ